MHTGNRHSISSALHIHVPPSFPLRARTLLSLVTTFPRWLGMLALYGKTHTLVNDHSGGPERHKSNRLQKKNG